MRVFGHILKIIDEKQSIFSVLFFISELMLEDS